VHFNHAVKINDAVFGNFVIIKTSNPHFLDPGYSIDT